MTDHVRSEIANGVLTLTLNRPEKKNALTRDMYQALGDGIDGAGQSDEIRCVLIQAEGDMFTAGNDLGDFAAANRGEPDAAPGGGNPLLVALARATTPLVAAVNGRAVGVGTTMLLHCDLVIAEPAARFSLPFVDLALVPEAASTLLLPKLAGRRLAARYLLLAESFGAEQALQMGILSHISPPGDLDGELSRVVASLLAKPAEALQQTQALLRSDGDHDVLARMALEAKAFGERLQSDELKAAIAAFFASRRT